MNILINDETFKQMKSTDAVPLRCSFCGLNFFIQKKAFTYAKKQLASANPTKPYSRQAKYTFCSEVCGRMSKGCSFLTKCLVCERHVRRRKTDLKKNKGGNFFCSHHCSATYSNRTRLFPQPQGKCKECGVTIQSKFSYCSKHKFGIRKFTLDLRLEDAIYKTGAPSNKYVGVRMFARSLIERLNRKMTTKLFCNVCGYDTSIDICHIKGIATFGLDSTLGEINSLTNLVTLCPNHHRELDRGLTSFPISNMKEQYSLDSDFLKSLGL